MCAALGALVLGAHACHSVPLLAPSGSAITFLSPGTTSSTAGTTTTTTATALSTDTVTIIAQVLEGATGTTSGTGTPGNANNAAVAAGGGQPVHNGTHVTFITTLGTITPADATTVNGKVTVTFSPGGAVGTATVTATSGAAVKTLTFTVTAPPGGGA
jgi:hypothetical protein